MRLLAAALAAGLICSPVAALAADGYLAPAEVPAIADWLAPAPATGSVREAADLEDYFATRGQLTGVRGVEAMKDDVYQPRDVVQRFDEALGFKLSEANAPRFLSLMARVLHDQEATLGPVKHAVSEGGADQALCPFFVPGGLPPPEAGSEDPAGERSLPVRPRHPGLGLGPASFRSRPWTGRRGPGDRPSVRPKPPGMRISFPVGPRGRPPGRGRPRGASARRCRFHERLDRSKSRDRQGAGTGRRPAQIAAQASAHACLVV